MIKLFNNKTKVIAIRNWWSWYIYWIPTIMTEYHPKEQSVLTNIGIGDEFNANGSCFTVTVFFLVWNINIDYWWNLTLKNGPLKWNNLK